MRRALALLPLLAACASSDDAHRLATQGVFGSPAAASFTSNVLEAQVTVAGGTAPLLVDTGAPVTTIAPARLPVAPGSGTADLTVGGLTVLGAPVLGVDPFAARGADVGDPAGLLGGSLLCQFVVVLDYRAAQVTLATTAPDPSAAAFPFRLEGGGQGTLAGGSFRYPPTRIPISASVEGTDRALLVDSGASYLVLRDAAFQALVADGRKTLDGVPILSASGTLSGRMARARAVAVGTDAVAEVPILDVGDDLLDALSREVGHPLDGLLGGSVLRAFRVTVDYPASALRLAPYDALDFLDPDEFHQVGVALGPAPQGSAHDYQLAVVYPGTAAAAAGLQPGQLLVAVDGQPLDGLPITAASRLLHGPLGATRRLATDGPTVDVAVDDLLPPL